MKTNILIITSQEKTYQDKLSNDLFNLHFSEESSIPEVINLINSLQVGTLVVDDASDSKQRYELIEGLKKKTPGFHCLLISDVNYFPQGLNPFHVHESKKLSDDFFQKKLHAFSSNYLTEVDELIAKMREFKAKDKKDFDVREESYMLELDSNLKDLVIDYTPLTEDEKPKALLGTLDALLKMTNDLNQKIK